MTETSFTVTFLGTSGGPIDGITCSTLIKPKKLSYARILEENLLDQILCIDAGSGFQQLIDVIYQETNNISSNKLLSLYNDSMKLQDYFKVKIVKPFENLSKNFSPFFHTKKVLDTLQCYLITHPHLDHILALVINSAGFVNGIPKKIYGSSPTINALRTHIFNGVIWPDFDKFNVIKLIEKPFWTPWSGSNLPWEITMFDISHGKLLELNHPHQESHYVSSAFLIRHLELNSSLLIFGDFESDLVSSLTKNKKIWNYIAPMIVDKSKPLKAIILECSLLDIPSNKQLYGHLIPQHLITELLTLENECKQLTSDKSPLQGLNIIITHVKEPIETMSDPRKQILHHLEMMNQEYNFGINFSIALTGISVEI